MPLPTKTELLEYLQDTNTRDYTNLILDAKDVDYETLHADIKADLGDSFIGLSNAHYDEGELIIIHVAKNSTGTERSKARAKFDAHDVSTLPPKVPKKTPEQRIEELELMVAQLMNDKAQAN